MGGAHHAGFHVADRTCVAVAGATGNAGREIVKSLASRGVRVRALVRNPVKLRDARRFCHDVKFAQVTEPGTLRGTLDGADYLVSAVGKTWQKDKVSRLVVDVGSIVNLVEEARRADIQRIALISVAGASLDHPVAMMRIKAEAESALKGSGIPWVIVQPGGYFSDMWQVFQMCRKGICFCIGDGTLPFNPIATEDLGEFTAMRLLDDAQVGKTLQVGGPEVFTQADLARVSERIIGKRVRLVRIPLWVARAAITPFKLISRNTWELADLFVGSVEYGTRYNSTILPPFGTHRLEDYVRARYSAETVAATSLLSRHK